MKLQSADPNLFDIHVGSKIRTRLSRQHTFKVFLWSCQRLRKGAVLIHCLPHQGLKLIMIQQFVVFYPVNVATLPTFDKLAMNVTGNVHSRHRPAVSTLPANEPSCTLR